MANFRIEQYFTGNQLVYYQIRMVSVCHSVITNVLYLLITEIWQSQGKFVTQI